MKEASNFETSGEIEEPKEIKVAVSELRGDNVLDEATLEIADMVELKFLDKSLPSKERLVHLFPYYETDEGKVSLDIADDNFASSIEKLNLPAKINEINPKWVSLHFGWAADPLKIAPEEIQKYKEANIEEEDKEKLFERVCSNINRAKEIFAGREVLLENLDFVPNAKHGGAAKTMVDPEFIVRVLEETDSGFILDLEHAYVSARNLGIKYSDYLSRMPLDRVREIHLSRPAGSRKSRALKETGRAPAEKDRGDILVDVHKALTGPEGKFTDRAYVILKSIWQSMPNLEVVTLELNLPPDSMKENLDAVKEIIKKIKEK